MNLKKLNPVQKIGLGITLVALAATIYSFWPHLTPPRPIAGTYLSKTDMELSWITITEGAEKNQISCAWYEMQTDDKGVVKEHRVTLGGTVNGKDISLSTTLPGQVELSGAGLREKDSIRLSLRMQGKVIYTGEYDPSDELSMVAAASDFNKNAARLAQDWDQKLQSRATGGKTAQDQAAMHRKMIEQSNAYIRKMDEVIKGAPAVQASYRSNTEKSQGVSR